MDKTGYEIDLIWLQLIAIFITVATVTDTILKKVKMATFDTAN